MEYKWGNSPVVRPCGSFHLNSYALRSEHRVSVSGQQLLSMASSRKFHWSQRWPGGRTHGQLSGKSHKEKWIGKWWLIDINSLSLNWPSNFRCTAFSNKAITREGSWLHCRWGPNTTPIMAKTLSMACVTSSGHGNLLACAAMTHREAQELPQITLPSSQSHQIHQSLFPLPATPCLFACITISDVGIRTGLELLELLLLLGPAKAREPVQIKLCEDRTSGGESQIRTLVKPHKWEKNERWDTWIYGHVDGERMINPWVWSSWAKSDDNSPDVWTPVSHPKPRSLNPYRDTSCQPLCTDASVWAQRPSDGTPCGTTTQHIVGKARIMLVWSLEPPFTADVAAMTATTKFRAVFWKISDKIPASNRYQGMQFQHAGWTSGLQIGWPQIWWLIIMLHTIKISIWGYTAFLGTAMLDGSGFALRRATTRALTASSGQGWQ